MTLRQRLEHSASLAWAVAALIGGYLWLCQRTTRWAVQGRDALDHDLATGPVLLVMWHERSLMGPVHWPSDVGPLSSLHAASPIGRASGALQRRFGLQPIEMSDTMSNRAASRAILKRVRDGVSIGMTGDGPLGPVRQVKDAPLDWARVMGRPVYAYAFATRRHRLLQTWDRMMAPLPWTKGAVVFVKCAIDLPRDATAPQIESARAELARFLSNTVSTADSLVQDA